MFNKDIFKEFHTDLEAHEWAMHNFAPWIKKLQQVEDNHDENNIENLLNAYTGSENLIINRFLRGNCMPYEDNLEELSRKVEIIEKEICKFKLQENIIVYRYTHKNFLRQLFGHSEIKREKVFVEKAIMSTTLVANLLIEFAKNRKCNCLVKLYLPKGTKGVYVKFDNGLLNEHEFLLPPNSKFKLIGKSYSFKYGMFVYKCELVSQ